MADPIGENDPVAPDVERLAGAVELVGELRGEELTAGAASAVSVVLGLALIGLGVWLAWNLSLPWHWPAALVLVAFGVWRTYRGVGVLISMRDGH